MSNERLRDAFCIVNMDEGYIPVFKDELVEFEETLAVLNRKGDIRLKDFSDNNVNKFFNELIHELSHGALNHTLRGDEARKNLELKQQLVNSGLYDEMLQYQAVIKRLKNQGIDVPTMTEINATNKMKLNRLKRKRAYSR